MALGGALGLGLVARDNAALCMRGRRGTNSHLSRRFALQARHKLTSTVVLRGRRGTNSHLPSFCAAAVALMALGGALGLGLVARDAAALCVAGAVQTHIYRRLAWQAWHKLTSTFVLRGRRGTDGTGWRLPSFCVAGVAQTHMYHRFAWQMMFATRVAPAYRINDIVSQVRFQFRFLLFAHVLLISLAQSKMWSSDHLLLLCLFWPNVERNDASCVFQMMFAAWVAPACFNFRPVFCYIHTYIHACIHTYIHTFIHSYIHTLLTNLNKYPESEGFRSETNL